MTSDFFYRTINSSKHARLSEVYNPSFPVRLFACPITSRAYYKTPRSSDIRAYMSEVLSLLSALCTLFSALFSGSFPGLRRVMAKMSQRRHPHSVSPPMYYKGGCSRVCRRPLWCKICKSAPSSCIPAAHFGDNSATSANKKSGLSKIWSE
jgi:hypothetical protein